MARPKRGQIFQFQAPARASSDGSLITTMTASDFNSGAVCKWFGVNHGVSDAFTSGTMSKAARLTSSGLLQFTLNATENNYDEMVFRARKTSMRPMFIAWNNADYDDSDLMSRLSDVASDLRSVLTLHTSTLSDIQSALSDFQSDFQSRVPKAVANNSQLSYLASDLRSYLVGMSGMLSDVQSAVTIVQSMASDAASAAQQGNSRVLLTQSRISDAQSFLSDMQSDLLSLLNTTGVGLNASTMSDIRSAINGLTVTIGASDISDIASAVVAGLPVTSAVSDIYSMLSDLMSDFQSRVPKRVATDSQLSDLHSDLRSYLVGVSGMLSDVQSAVALTQSMASDAASAAQQGNSRVLLNQSRISDVYSLLSDLQSDFQSRVPKETAARSQLSDLASDLRSYLAGLSGVLSDAYSLLVDGPEIGASSLSDIRSAITANGLLAAGADVTGAIGPTDTRGAKIDWLTAMSRNKLTQTSSSAVLFNDAGTAVASATVSDDGTTFTRDEWH